MPHDPPPTRDKTLYQLPCEKNINKPKLGKKTFCQGQCCSFLMLSSVEPRLGNTWACASCTGKPHLLWSFARQLRDRTGGGTEVRWPQSPPSQGLLVNIWTVAGWYFKSPSFGFLATSQGAEGWLGLICSSARHLLPSAPAPALRAAPEEGNLPAHSLGLWAPGMETKAKGKCEAHSERLHGISLLVFLLRVLAPAIINTAFLFGKKIGSSGTKDKPGS